MALCCPSQFGGYKIKHVYLWIVVGSVILGLSGNLKIAAFTYIGRVSTPTTSGRNFMYPSIAMGLAVCVGPLTGILIAKATGSARLVLWFAVILCAGSLAVVLLAWPGRKLLPIPDRPAQWTQALPCLLLKVVLCSSNAMLAFAVMAFTDHFGLNMLHSGYAVFARKEFEWTTNKISLFLVASGLCAPLAQRGLLPWLLRTTSELFVLRVGFVATLLSFLYSFIVGLTPCGDLLFGTCILAAVGFIANPVLMALASREVPKSEQGRLFAAMTFLDTVSKMLAPLMTDYVMSRTLGGPMPSAVFLVASFLVLPAVALAWVVKPPSDSESDGKCQDSSDADSSDE